jgi:prefoldin alpha subunit
MKKRKKELGEREKAIEFELLRAEAAEIEKRLMELESQRVELEFVKQSLEDVRGSKEEELLVPIGSGTFLRGRLTDDEKVLVNVGANVVIEKTIEEARETLQNQIEQVERAEKNLRMDLERFLKRMREIRPELMGVRR